MIPGTTNDKQNKLLQMQLMNTVEENKTFSTTCQQAEAKRERELYNLVGCRSVGDLKLVIRMNLIRDNTVTNKAVQWATKLYGPDIGQLKAQTTRIKPNSVVDTSIDIPDELIEVKKDTTITMDVLKIDGLNFLSTTYLHIYFRTMHYMPNT